MPASACQCHASQTWERFAWWSRWRQQVKPIVQVCSISAMSKKFLASHPSTKIIQLKFCLETATEPVVGLVDWSYLKLEEASPKYFSRFVSVLKLVEWIKHALVLFRTSSPMMHIMTVHYTDGTMIIHPHATSESVIRTRQSRQKLHRARVPDSSFFFFIIIFVSIFFLWNETLTNQTFKANKLANLSRTRCRLSFLCWRTPRIRVWDAWTWRTLLAVVCSCHRSRRNLFA